MPKSREEDLSHRTRPNRDFRHEDGGPSHHSVDGKYAPRRRSRTPAGGSSAASETRRSASPDRESRRSHGHHRHHHHKRDSRPQQASERLVELPHSTRPLNKADFDAFEPLFAYYLDLQKQKYLEDMDDREVKGRWKSFVGKWNRGELAEGWYDPEMFAKCTTNRSDYVPDGDRRVEHNGSSMESQPSRPSPDRTGSLLDDSDSDGYGPALPGSDERRTAGAQIPSMQDLSLRNEMITEQREQDRDDLRQERKADRALQKERMEELVPRAEPGSRERRLEKRKETNDKMRHFRDKSPGMEGTNEQDLMGGGDSLGEYKRAKEQEQKKKSERQIQREEFERAKREEMEERRRAYQEREEGTVSMLRELARQRFG